MRRALNGAEKEDRLTQAIIALASQYGRYGYRRKDAVYRTRLSVRERIAMNF
jgi:hypothetical protein